VGGPTTAPPDSASLDFHVRWLS